MTHPGCPRSRVPERARGRSLAAFCDREERGDSPLLARRHVSALAAAAAAVGRRCGRGAAARRRAHFHPVLAVATSTMRNFSTSTTREEATLEHCVYAFSVLEAHLHGRALPGPTFADAHTALFVTWNVRNPSSSSSEWRLRGCIGTLEPRQLHVALRDYALTAALRDSRFPAIEARELPRLSCKVSLLSCFERASSWQDWEVGTHGIVIEYTDPQLGCRRSATFLPEVADEQGWSVQETLEALVRKSGYSGRVDAALLGAITLTRYQSSVKGLHWEQYVEELHARQGGAEGPEHVVGSSNALVSVTTTRGRAA